MPLYRAKPNLIVRASMPNPDDLEFCKMIAMQNYRLVETSKLDLETGKMVPQGFSFTDGIRGAIGADQFLMFPIYPIDSIMSTRGIDQSIFEEFFELVEDGEAQK